MPKNSKSKNTAKQRVDDLDLDAFFNDTDEKELANKDDAIDTPVEIQEVAKDAEEKKNEALEQLQAAIDDVVEEEAIELEENQQELEEHLEAMELADDDVEQQSDRQVNQQELADHIQNMGYAPDDVEPTMISAEQMSQLSATLSEIDFESDEVDEPEQVIKTTDEQMAQLSSTLSEIDFENDTESDVESAAESQLSESEIRQSQKFAERISEVHKSETSFIDSVLKLREPLEAMQAMKKNSASDTAYQQLTDLISTVEALHKKFPDNLESVMSLKKDGTLAIDQKQFLNYVGEIQKAADIAEKFITSGEQTNILKDFAAAKSAGKISQDVLQNDIQTAALAPGQRVARYAILIDAAMPTANQDNKAHLSEAHKSVKQVLDQAWLSKKEPTTPLTRTDLIDRLNQVAALASQLGVTSGTKTQYFEEFRKIKEAMSKGEHMEAINLHVTKVLDAATKAVNKAEGRTLYSDSTKALHQQIQTITAKIMHDATDPKSAEMLAQPTPPKPEPPKVAKTHMSFTETFRNPVVESLREARDLLRAAIAESKKENPDSKKQSELLSKADYVLQGAKTQNALIEVNKGETSQVKATKEIIDHLKTGIDREMKSTNQNSPGRKG